VLGLIGDLVVDCAGSPPVVVVSVDTSVVGAIVGASVPVVVSSVVK